MKKIIFYWKRVSACTPAEIIYRIKWKINQHLNQRIKRLIKNVNPTLITLERRNNLKYFKYPKMGNFPFEKFKREEVIKSYKKNFTIEKTINMAEKYYKHKIQIFDIKNRNLGKIINWNKDYKTNKIWPKEYISKQHHADAEKGFVRYIWELNRYGHLPIMALAFYLTKNKKYAEEVIKQIESWIDQNPYLKTINWFSGLELGIRAINWIWSLKLIKDYEGLNEGRFNKIAKSIYLHYDTIISNLSLYSSANNHLIGELTSIKIITTIFPYFKLANKWNKLSTKLLREEIKKQIYIDGVGKEQSTNYLLFIIDLYLQASIIDKNMVKGETKKRIENAGKFIYQILENREDIPQIGDSDDAKIINFYEDKKNNATSILNSLAIMCSNGIFKFYGKKIDEKTFWMFSIRGINKYNKIKKVRNRINSHMFKMGGYFISKNKETSLIFDCGKLGYLSTAAHGHCDALSFILAINKKEFFVDSGTYTYYEDYKLRNYFKSTCAHNTIMIDKKEQSEMKGEFLYGKKADIKILNYYISKDRDKISAYHDGYSKLGVIHKREISHLKNKKTIIIKDNINTKGNHIAYIYFILHPKVKIKEQKNNTLLLERNKIKIKLILDKKISIKINKSWFSEAFGVKISTLKIEGKLKVNNPTIINTIICWEKESLEKVMY